MIWIRQSCIPDERYGPINYVKTDTSTIFEFVQVVRDNEDRFSALKHCRSCKYEQKTSESRSDQHDP